MRRIGVEATGRVCDVNSLSYYTQVLSEAVHDE